MKVNTPIAVIGEARCRAGAAAPAAAGSAAAAGHSRQPRAEALRGADVAGGSARRRPKSRPAPRWSR